MLNGAARPTATPPVPNASQAPQAPPQSAPVETAPAFNFNDERIPSASVSRIEAIRGLLAEIEKQAQITNTGRDALDEARRIQNAYLPELMNSYFVIPAAHRAEIFRRTGKSASFQLNARLDAMIEELRRIARSFAAGQIDSFSVNLRFIDQRFKDPGDNGPF